MKIVFASRTGNVQSMVESLNLKDSLHIISGTEAVDSDYILFTYTDGYGDIPYEIEVFLTTYSDHLKGVIVSGDLAYGEAYCVVGDIIAERYGIEFLYKFENQGTSTDRDNIQAIIDSL